MADGVAPGDRVRISASNQLEWVLAQFTTTRGGGIVVDINPVYKTNSATPSGSRACNSFNSVLGHS